MWNLLKTAGNDWLRHSDALLGAALAYYSVFFARTPAADRSERRRPILLAIGNGKGPECDEWIFRKQTFPTVQPIARPLVSHSQT